MLNIGWSEMLIIAAIALIVVGPKDLPVMLRQLGRVFSTVRRMGNEFKSELSKVAAIDEFKEAKKSITDPLNQTSQQIASEFNKIGENGVEPTGKIKPKIEGSESVADEIREAAGLPPMQQQPKTNATKEAMTKSVQSGNDRTAAVKAKGDAAKAAKAQAEAAETAQAPVAVKPSKTAAKPTATRAKAPAKRPAAKKPAATKPAAAATRKPASKSAAAKPKAANSKPPAKTTAKATAKTPASKTATRKPAAVRKPKPKPAAPKEQS